MSNPFADTLHLRVRASAAHRVFIAVLHIAAAVLITLMGIARPWLFFLLPAIAVAGRYAYRDASLGRPGSIHHLRWQHDGQWRWQTASGEWERGRLVGVFTAGDWLVVLRLRAEHHRLRTRTCVLFRDALPVQAHRHLRARLTIAPALDAPDTA
ncbi:hypothetical protein SSPSH_002902 [Salinisphaera shabanensis E1L3A]|uniref:Toxin CptA n=1 Tax=Salinisphaera shabanensis E1L3A TaxID=1033802 RepID=U2FQ56_9GAMM|nr:protein YgfX [Salinisphaera shabanensis]ERJ18274.1 hypothetical protein SSPSH_002902 [Salinisphaera shabanensis E1L3A]